MQVLYSPYFFICLVCNCALLTEANVQWTSAFLACSKELLKNGVWDWQLPSFNPLVDDHPEINLDSLNIPDILSGRVYLHYAIVEGIPYYTSQNLTEDYIIDNNLKSVEISTILNFGRLSAHAEYDGRVDLFNNKIFFGDGIIRLLLLDLYMKTHFKAIYNQVEDVWKVEVFNVLPNIRKGTVNITGLYNNEIFSQELTNFINDNAMDFINDNSVLLGSIFEIALRILLNVMHVSQKAVEKTIEMMFNECDIDL